MFQSIELLGMAVQTQLKRSPSYKKTNILVIYIRNIILGKRDRMDMTGILFIRNSLEQADLRMLPKNKINLRKHTIKTLKLESLGMLN